MQNYLHIDYINPAYEFWYIGFRVAHLPEPVPTISQWGLIATALLILTAGSVVIARRYRWRTR